MCEGIYLDEMKVLDDKFMTSLYDKYICITSDTYQIIFLSNLHIFNGVEGCG